MQALLRGVVPGSFPFMLAPEPEVTTGLRRLVVIDNNVERIYGDKLRKVRGFVCCGPSKRQLLTKLPFDHLPQRDVEKSNVKYASVVCNCSLADFCRHLLCTVSVQELCCGCN